MKRDEKKCAKVDFMPLDSVDFFGSHYHVEACSINQQNYGICIEQGAKLIDRDTFKVKELQHMVNDQLLQPQVDPDYPYLKTYAISLNCGKEIRITLNQGFMPDELTNAVMGFIISQAPETLCNA